jgi:hypothetical protein
MSAMKMRPPTSLHRPQLLGLSREAVCEGAGDDPRQSF